MNNVNRSPEPHGMEAGPSLVAGSPPGPVPTYPPLDYTGQMILAPMVKIGTLPMRLLALDYGAGIVYTEEIIDFRLLRCVRIENTVMDTIDYVDRLDDTLVLRVSPRERGKLVLQIGTCDPKRAVKVAQMVENDVDGIDVNMGCPKPFSLKGGMGAALLNHPDKIKDILVALVQAAKIPITCKIRIKSDFKETMDIVRVIESTGVRAFAVHGRTKDERPNHDVHTDVLEAIVKEATLPVIVNGGSSNNRNSADNTYEGLKRFWAQTGASSVMVARAAEWNPSVFRPEGKAPIMEVVHKYLDYAIHFNYTFVIVKYTIQQILGSEQDSEMGKTFLHSATMRDLCRVFGREDEIVARQAIIRERSRELNVTTTTFRFCRDAKIVPKKQALSSAEIDEYRQTFVLAKTDDSEAGPRSLLTDENPQLTSMFCPFVRNHYGDSRDIPKCLLVNWCRIERLPEPKYITTQTEKTFRSVVCVSGQLFRSDSWEKNRKYSEQATAIVALHCLGIRKMKSASL